MILVSKNDIKNTILRPTNESLSGLLIGMGITTGLISLMAIWSKIDEHKNEKKLTTHRIPMDLKNYIKKDVKEIQIPYTFLNASNLYISKCKKYRNELDQLFDKSIAQCTKLNKITNEELEALKKNNNSKLVEIKKWSNQIEKELLNSKTYIDGMDKKDLILKIFNISEEIWTSRANDDDGGEEIYDELHIMDENEDIFKKNIYCI